MKNKMTRAFWDNRTAERIITEYLISIIGFAALAVLLYYSAQLICECFIWLPDNPLYIFLKRVQGTVLQWGPTFIAAGIAAISVYYIAKILKYLSDTVSAAKQLSSPSDVPIKLTRNLSQVQDSLNLAREQAIRNQMLAKEAEQRKNDLIVYLAHDLKTPLTSVIGYLTLMKDEPEISPQMRAKYTGIALEKAERLEELINEFFDITRFNLTKITLEKEKISITRMLEQITFEFDPVLAGKNLQWDKSIDGGVYCVCDGDKLERVFDNILKNAVNYSYEGTKIFVELKQTDDMISIRVKNSGKTIPPEKLSRIFEQFFRLDSSRSTATGGAGLGLAIAKEIVELHGGTISAKSSDESIEFEAILPSGL